ncbi:hypothetical protein SLEP1_g3642 [Rubroshorea leprosula]|uniref:Integrase catalytic domain-containing protein n=1 Tax=Rubroshorea leprosula TaxID=152421 RepID=A0AAV5HL51_9ROSI|nr:hypothetical protein SLEP1_g3642 [Rubroshorea leprosula]
MLELAVMGGAAGKLQGSHGMARNWKNNKIRVNPTESREEDAGQIWNFWVEGESSRLETWFLSKKGGKFQEAFIRFFKGRKSVAWGLFGRKDREEDRADQIEYLGHYISKEGVSTDPKKILAVQQWPQPKTVKELRGFLGLTGYYRREASEAFESFKHAVTTTPVLVLPDFSKEFVMETDASNVGIGVVLLQQGHPIAFINKALSLRHQSLSVYEKELLALIYAISCGNNATLRRKFIHLVHDSAMGGHSGIQASTKRLVLLFYWKGLEKDVRQYIRQCDVCQRYKPENTPTPGLLQPLPIPKAIWTQVSMDFITSLPKSYGKDVIFVVVDRLTKYAHFIALQHPYSALTVAQAYMDNVFKLHGLPQDIVSDKDPIFLSNFWQELFKLQGVELQCSSAYHPQIDGQTEVVNRCLENYLRCMIGDRPTKWSKWLPLAEWWYNTNFHTTTQISPFEALYGFPPPLHIVYVPGDSDVATGDQSLQAWEAMLKVIDKVGKVAYKLALPDSSQIHPVIHVSQLKKKVGAEI